MIKPNSLPQNGKMRRVTGGNRASCFRMEISPGENSRCGDGGTEGPSTVGRPVGEIRNYAFHSPSATVLMLARSDRSIRVDLESTALRLLDKVRVQNIEVPHDRPHSRV